MKKMILKKKGQGMTEYILIVALIALVAVASIQLFGDKISARFKSLADTISA
jgi:Flp pilus assembly pilin Flp